MEFHHIGYLVKNIQKSMKAFRTIGYEPVSFVGEEDITYDPLRMCDITFMKNVGDPAGNGLIELICPTSQDSPIWGLMKKYKNGPYHMCFSSKQIQQDIEKCLAEGWIIINPLTPAIALNDRDVVFLMHRTTGIIEIISDGEEL